MPASRHHNLFHRSKNRTARQTFFSTNIILPELRIIYIKHFICMSKLQIWHLKNGPVPFGTCICSNVETIRSWTCHIYGPFEFRTSLGTSILLFSAKTYLIAMRCSVTSHFGVNFRDNISTCVFDFQSKIFIALPIAFMFYTPNVYCPLNIYYKEF